MQNAHICLHAYALSACRVQYIHTLLTPYPDIVLCLISIILDDGKAIEANDRSLPIFAHHLGLFNHITRTGKISELLAV